MSCSPFDLRDYFLKELSDPQQRQMEGHVKACQPCREELDRLRLTEAALLGLPDEEIPQRIAFVSDKIFEPSPWRRRVAAFWNSGARLGFASAAMLSAALLVSAFTRPAPAPVMVNAAMNASGKMAVVSTISTEEIDRRIQTAVNHAVQDVEIRQAKENEKLVNEIKRRDNALLAARNDADIMIHQYNVEKAQYRAGDQQ
jgi:hypothetical protein